MQATRAHLVLRITFSLAWWAFVFPLSATAVAFIYYADSIHDTWQKWVVTGIALFFWALATVAFVIDSLGTIWKFCKGTLFPEDEVTKALVEGDERDGDN